jgi:hypothetical protein
MMYYMMYYMMYSNNNRQERRSKNLVVVVVERSFLEDLAIQGSSGLWKGRCLSKGACELLVSTRQPRARGKGSSHLVIHGALLSDGISQRNRGTGVELETAKRHFQSEPDILPGAPAGGAQGQATRLVLPLPVS